PPSHRHEERNEVAPGPINRARGISPLAHVRRNRRQPVPSDVSPASSLSSLYQPPEGSRFIPVCARRRASVVPDGGGEALGARREESIGIVRIRLRDGDEFLGNSREGFGPADVGGGHRWEPPRFREQPFMFYKDAQEKSRNYVSDEHSSSRFQPVSTIDAFEASQ
ncbi:unnamed protein product, partial [Musa acuminata subsp. burmannicoides]